MAEVIREKNTSAKNSGYPAEILDVVLQAHGKKVSQVLRDNVSLYGADFMRLIAPECPCIRNSACLHP